MPAVLRRAQGRPALAAVILVILLRGVGAVLAVIRVYGVHEQGWEWRWTPSEAPGKIHFGGRDYSRGDPGGSIGPDDVRAGLTPGGGVIYRPRDSRGTPVVIEVATEEEVFSYGLMGGP